MLPDMERVTRLLVEVAEEEVLPRFRSLKDHEIRHKSGGEVVTVVDEVVERRLSAALVDLVPGARFLGEEAAASDPGLFGRLGEAGPLWVIDPVDGTRNFANGVSRFAVMLAFVRAGETLMSWIHDPIDGTTAMAQAGEGARLDGRTLSVAAPAPVEKMIGTLHAGQFAPPEMVRQVRSRRDRVKAVKSLGCAGAEYVRLARGELHFTLFTKMMPWDHAPGVLIHREAGGCARTLAGEDYQPAMTDAHGLLMAPDEPSWQSLNRVLFGPA